jgi:methionyl-tRNA synthetase
MPKEKPYFYITSPIYYVNDKPHIGHCYTSLACDVLARFKRLCGYEVLFLTGTDEHGQKVEKSALAKGKTLQEFCDEVSAKFKDLTKFMGFSNDDFIRTTDKRHKKTVQEIWNKLDENGWIYKDVYEGWYAIRDEAFYNENELLGGKAPTGAEVVWHKEESYFFKLSAFQDNLLALYEAVPDFIQPQSKSNEVISFVKSGLKDLSISRTSFKWGIKAPNDEKHIIYVWLDALVNYLSALDYPNGEKYKNIWDDGSNAITHIVGKDILRFHGVYWPAFLMAINIPLPTKIFAHGWWTNEGQKISKSVGNVIDPYQEVEWLQSFKYKEDGVEKNISQETAIDYLRYFLMKEVLFGNDGNYSRECFVNRINAELANKIGNLVQRVTKMIIKDFNGVVPIADKENIFLCDDIKAQYINSLNKLEYNEAIQQVINIANKSNENWDEQKPWKLEGEAKNQVIYQTIENIRIIGFLLLPFVPNSANKILNLLNISADKRNFANINDLIKSDYKLNEVKIIFPSIKN